MSCLLVLLVGVFTFCAMSENVNKDTKNHRNLSK